MNRRTFLSMLGMAAVAAPLARVFPMDASGQDSWALFTTRPQFNSMGPHCCFTPVKLSDYQPVVSAEEIARRERAWQAYLDQRGEVATYSDYQQWFNEEYG